MGGYGSTRWGYERIRLDMAGLLRLDVRWLAREGNLVPGAISTLTWTRATGEPACEIMTVMDKDRPRLTLRYATSRRAEATWTHNQEHIWLETTPCHYGGERWWFRCPQCDRRRAVLYCVASVFACRGCHDLVYASTREDGMARGDRRIRTLADWLGGAGNEQGRLFWTMPTRPKGMQRHTYDRLTHALQREHERREDLLVESAAKLISRIDHVLGRRG